MLAEKTENEADSLVDIVKEVWLFRGLLYQLTLRDIRIRYKQTVMGFAWALFMPALIVLSGMIVRLAMARLSGTPLETEALAGIAAKALPWAFFVGAINTANSSLIGNQNLVTKVYFPREVLPLASVLAQTFDTLVGTAALVLVLPFLGAPFSLALLWVPFLAAVLFLLTLAAGLFLSAANLFFRDVKYIVQVVLTFGIFFTPVFFEPAMFGSLGARLMMLNPVAPILEGIRLAVVEAHSLHLTIEVSGVLVWSPWYLAYSVIWACAGYLLAARMFHGLQYLFAEYA